MKRVLDVCLSILLLAVCLPLLTFLLIVIYAETRSLPIFTQKRLGLGQEPFSIFKLKTMHPVQLHSIARPHYGIKEVSFLKDGNQDPRVSCSGKLLRRWNLDEIPQLINIIRGDMSFVGPRPFDVREFEEGPHEHPGYAEWVDRRHEVRPGLTGLWQIYGRNTTSFSELMDLDLKYVKESTFRNDIGIMIRTLVLTITGR